MPQPGRLTVVQGSLPSTEYPLPLDGTVTIGRNRRMNIPIFMRTVSRKHARIACRNGTYTISDLGSKAGTLVNDHKVTKTVLRHGDRIQIGRVKFRFWMQAPERQPPRESAPQGPVVEVLREPVVIPPKPAPPPEPAENEPEGTAASYFTAEELGRVGRTLGGTKLIAAVTRTRRLMIYKGTQASHNRVVAFKMLRPEAAKKPEIVSWFVEGAKRASELSHEDIIGPLGGGSEKGVIFLYLLFMHNGSALERFSRATEEGIPAAKRALEALVRVTRALEFAHSSGILHLGLRPSKILFNEEQRAKVVGLGFDNGTSAGGAQSTPEIEAYLAPEQSDPNGNTTVMTDIFSLGATFYYMLTGQHPQRDRRQRIPSPKGMNRAIPDSVCRIAEKMVNPDPQGRYQSYGLLLHDLRWALRGEAWPHA
jgi:serine/threonine protein kinase